MCILILNIVYVADGCLLQKRRGKRLAPDTSVSNAVDDHLSKKSKVEKESDKETDKSSKLSYLTSYQPQLTPEW